MYIPKPIDTTEVILPNEILELIEHLAKNTHEVWAKQRLSEGWTYGKKRDDLQKTNPCLIEYELLPENEKQYDRNTAMETLKLIYTLGYVVTKKS